ncbi:hypothetical protein BD311DRAFT_767672 [Dichomitus squalens]|uniref:Uncharacterized protein n=1 Tax=Dichomitus squalens TaxID=114155 RepID=A0A4Q9MCY6_9APHY|nr:hypothetical protein BD311DRAFT_767672 [Dichomitus squalens]
MSGHNVAIQRISNAVSAPAFDIADGTLRRHVYNDIKDNVLPLVPSTATPPLPVLVYAVHNIIQPSFVLGQIPDLLSLLAHIEVFRLNTIEKINRILRRDKTLRRDRSPSVRLLADHDRDDLERIVSPSRVQAARKVYRQIVHGCSLLHIHHIWRTSPGGPSPLHYLIQYFPYFVQRDQDAAPQCTAALSTYPWHYNLSRPEQRENEEIGEVAANFILGASQYLDDKEGYCRENGYDADEPFEAIFPPPRQDANVNAIDKYMSVVTGAADTLQAILEDAES